MSNDQVLEDFRVFGLPKGAVMWPTALTALVLGLIAMANDSLNSAFSAIFLIVFTINLLILFFDFARGAVVGIIGILIAIGTIVYTNDISLPAISSIGDAVTAAPGSFLFMYGLIYLSLLLIAYLFNRSFNYFVIASNEIVKKQGILGDADRFNAPSVSISKTIPDVFESLLLFGAGDLRIKTNDEIFHIRNVPRINQKEKMMREILGRLEVDTN